jgi:hypothetical protein
VIGRQFLLEDAGEGWWHCPSPLTCTVLAGPDSWGAKPTDVSHILVRTQPAVEWNGDLTYAVRWGPEHALCHPIEPTNLLLVMASSTTWTPTLDNGTQLGTRASPVLNNASSVRTAECRPGLGMVANVSPL